MPDVPVEGQVVLRYQQAAVGQGTRDGLVVGCCCSGDVVLAVLAMDGGRAASFDQSRSAVGEAVKATFKTSKTTSSKEITIGLLFGS